MGFLSVQTETLNWEEAAKMQGQIKSHGVKQLINLWNTFKDIEKSEGELKWGDEVEYHVFTLKESEPKKAQIFAEGFKAVKETQDEDPVHGFQYQEEFGSWMVEAVPEKPYGLAISRDLSNESKNALRSLMKRRNEMNEKLFSKNLALLSLPAFPNMGHGDFFDSEKPELLE